MIQTDQESCSVRSRVNQYDKTLRITITQEPKRTHKFPSQDEGNTSSDLGHTPALEAGRGSLTFSEHNDATLTLTGSDTKHPI